MLSYLQILPHQMMHRLLDVTIYIRPILQTGKDSFYVPQIKVRLDEKQSNQLNRFIEERKYINQHTLVQ